MKLKWAGPGERIGEHEIVRKRVDSVWFPVDDRSKEEGKKPQSSKKWEIDCAVNKLRKSEEATGWQGRWNQF